MNRRMGSSTHNLGFPAFPDIYMARWKGIMAKMMLSEFIHIICVFYGGNRQSWAELLSLTKRGCSTSTWWWLRVSREHWASHSFQSHSEGQILSVCKKVPKFTISLENGMLPAVVVGLDYCPDPACSLCSRSEHFSGTYSPARAVKTPEVTELQQSFLGRQTINFQQTIKIKVILEM